jgi:hypothetical protein
MKKITLEQLEIQNIASKVSEHELAQLKGGAAGTSANAVLAIPTVSGTHWTTSKSSTPICKSLIPPLLGV